MTAGTARGGLRPTPDDYDRFMAKVEAASSGCWLFAGAHDRDGYAIFSLRGRAIRAIRFVLWVRDGRRVPKNRVVLHKCDNPGCVNPDHLSVGTQRQNVHDCIAKGRFHSQRGGQNG